MIHLSTPGERQVSVRVDDLPEQERTLVRETLRLIKTMSDREAFLYIIVTIAGVLGFFGMVPILFHFIPEASFMVFMANAMAGGVLVGLLGWLIMRPIVNRHHDIDALCLSNFARHARCGELIREYGEANPWFAQAIKRRFEQVAAAQ